MRETGRRTSDARSCTPPPARCTSRGGAEPQVIKPTDAIIQISATCICGSDLWPYRGISPVTESTPGGHEYCGIVEEVGSAVKSIQRGQFVIGSFFASDNTCPICRTGYPSSCQNRELVGGAQAEKLRVPLADGTLVATPQIPSDEMIPSLLTLSDVMGTGWFAAEAANVKPGETVAVVGDGAVGLFYFRDSLGPRLLHLLVTITLDPTIRQGLVAQAPRPRIVIFHRPPFPRR